MSLYTVSSGQVVNASDVNQLVNVLQEGSGGVESSKYFIEGGCSNGTGWTIGDWIQTKSATSTPVSVTIDTSIVSPISVNAPTTQQLNSSGFFLGAGSSASSNTARFGGVWSVQY